MVNFASSPSPSRRNTVPRPYFGCCTTEPYPSVFFFAAGLNVALAGRAAGCCCTTAGFCSTAGGGGGPKSNEPGRGRSGFCGADGGFGLRPAGGFNPRCSKNCEMFATELYVLPVYKLRCALSLT